MDNSHNREDWRRERSLLALGRAMRGEDEAPPPARSLLALAGAADLEDERASVRARHGLARERREAAMPVEPPAAPEQWLMPGEEWRDPTPESATAVGFDGAVAPAGSAMEKPTGGAARRRSWRLVAITTVLGACLGAAVAFSLPVRYQATAELTLGGEKSGQMTVSAIDSQLRVLASGMVLTKVVDRLNLAGDPEFNGKDGGEGFAGLLRAILTRGDVASDDGHRQALAVDRLAGSLAVARGAELNSIAVTVTTGNGEKSALIANAVADTFVEVYKQSRLGAAVGETRDADPGGASILAAAQQRLSDFVRARGLGDLDLQRVSQILELDQNLAAARNRTESLNAQVAALRSAGADPAAAGLPRQFETGAMEALRAQYLDLKQQADSAAVKLGPRNPERRGIEAQVAGARDRLSAELRRIVVTQQAVLKQAVETEQAYAARLAKTGLTGEDIAALRDLQRQVAAAEIDRGAITASIPAGAAAASGQDAHVVTRASPPLQPSGPSRTTLTLAGTVLGLFAGLALGGLRGRTADAAMAEADVIEDEAIRPTPPGEPVGRDLSFAEDRGWSEPGSSPRDAASPGDAMPSWPLGQPAAISVHQSSATESFAIRNPTETVMHPAHPDQFNALAPQRPQSQPQQWVQPGYPPQFYPPQPAMQPVPSYPASPYPQQHAHPQAWQPAPPMPYPYVHPMQAYAGQFYPPQPSFAYPPQDAGPAIDHDALDEIRASLQEFREALRELAESRSRRRIF
jgi:uncharacterized protein involved in exopolysaccharide biosynthesis